MLNKVLHTESVARHKHYMQVKMKYYYIRKKKKPTNIEDGEIETIPFIVRFSL
jgi:hypothetical protein